MIWMLLLWLWVTTIGQDVKIYQVKHVDEEIEIDGKGTDGIWNQAALLTDFQLPWDEEVAQPTFFRALWSDEYYYFFYDVIDLDIVTPNPARTRRVDIPLDRIEIFFKSNGHMNPYYCLEMGPKGRVLDYVAESYRQFDFDWSWHEGGLEVQTNISDGRYQVEGKISLASLRSLGILNDAGQMDAGLFRGDYYHVNANKTQVRWISWVSPASAEPDFHIPSAFGKLILVE